RAPLAAGRSADLGQSCSAAQPAAVRARAGGHPDPPPGRRQSELQGVARLCPESPRLVALPPAHEPADRSVIGRVRVATAVRIGVDIGGTFTDVVASTADQVWTAKALTTPDSWADGVLAACDKVAQVAGWTLRELLGRTTRFGLGTTAVTNV